MKNIVFILLFISSSLFAQSGIIRSGEVLGSATADSIVTTGTKRQASRFLNGSYAEMSLQTTITKLSGTITTTAIGANCILQGSNDNSNWITLTTDTFTLTDVTTQSKVWLLPQPVSVALPTTAILPTFYPLGYISVFCTGKGTAHIRLNSTVVYRQ